MPLIIGADRSLRWFIEDVWGQFGPDHARPGAPLFPSERKCRDGTCARATADVFRRSLAGMSLFAIQELLGHSWPGTTARYIHIHGTRVEDAWVAGQQRAADRWKGLAR